jgi:hypothetical protein
MPGRFHRAAVLMLAALLLVTAFLAPPPPGRLSAPLWPGASPAAATPLYASREGRTCDSCHLTPNGWANPPLADRKCTMSCQSCHVDPSGGGLRNASGRFLGRSTLPMIATSPRPTADWDRELFGLLARKDRATTYSDSLPLGPATLADSRDPAYAANDLWGFGKPLGSPTRSSYFAGRYGRINSDPLVRIGWDVRLAALMGTGALVFPMQADLGAALHPVEHLTLYANVGARGRSSGWSDTIDDPGTPYLRHGFVMLHELPYLSYVKAGRFTPAFGLRIDDHTAQTRRVFEVEDALPETRVTGVEVGMNPNYPWFRASWFRSAERGRAGDPFDIFDLDAGHGWALDAGWREIDYSIGASVLQRRRPIGSGGDVNSYALTASFNPWARSRSVPLTWQAEFDVGDYRRESGLKANRMAFYQELDWLAANGINVVVAQDWSDPDRDVKDDESWRVSGGVQVTPVPGITLDARARVLLPMSDANGADVFVQLHLWN